MKTQPLSPLFPSNGRASHSCRFGKTFLHKAVFAVSLIAIALAVLIASLSSVANAGESNPDLVVGDKVYFHGEGGQNLTGTVLSMEPDGVSQVRVEGPAMPKELAGKIHRVRQQALFIDYTDSFITRMFSNRWLNRLESFEAKMVLFMLNDQCADGHCADGEQLVRIARPDHEYVGKIVTIFRRPIAATKNLVTARYLIKAELVDGLPANGAVYEFANHGEFTYLE